MTYPLKLLSLLGSTLAGIMLAGNCSALVLDAMPSYSISPSLNGLNISYFAKQDQVKINLYLVNHERFPVLCDAEYSGGPDKVDTPEQTVATDRAVEFRFPYPKAADNVVIQLICKKPDNTSDADTDTQETATPGAKAPDHAEPAAVKIIETDLSVKY